MAAPPGPWPSNGVDPARGSIASSDANTKGRASSAERGASSLPRMPAKGAPDVSNTVPQAFTATTAPTTASSKRITERPRPLFMACSMPNSLPTLAPVPAPKLPWTNGLPDSAACTACTPKPASGRPCASPTTRSNRHAAGTIGTHMPANRKPMPVRSSSSMAPVAAAKPNALPPESTTACTSCAMFSGRSASVSRVAGPPRARRRHQARQLAPPPRWCPCPPCCRCNCPV